MTSEDVSQVSTRLAKLHKRAEKLEEAMEQLEIQCEQNAKGANAKYSALTFRHLEVVSEIRNIETVVEMQKFINEGQDNAETRWIDSHLKKLRNKQK